MLRSMDGKSRINLWNWKESGIEKVQVLKGKERKEKEKKGKERERKERQGKAGTRQSREKARQGNVKGYR